MVGAALTIALVGLGAVGIAAPTKTVEDRQIIGPPNGGGLTPPSATPTCLTDRPIWEQPPCLYPPIGGGINPPPKEKRFWLPDGWDSDIQKAIDTLELKLERLQNKQHKTQADLQEIDDIYEALGYLAGVTNISAPPGVGSIFHPGKRSTNSAVGIYAGVCPGVVGAELALEKLMQKSQKSPEECVIEEKLKSFLLGCGITIIKSPDGTTTTITPSNKRTAAPYDLAGVEKAYEALVQSLGSSQPDFVTWLIMEQMTSILKLYGITIVKTPAGTTTTLVPGKRQSFTIGGSTCQLANILGFREALAALLAAYGPPENAPQNIQLLEQIIVTTLRLCGEGVPGWTGGIIPDPYNPGSPINPDPYNPGSPINPDPTVPGSPITPDPTVPGGPINPSDKRQVIVTDPAALLAALAALEKQYGNYGSGTIPVPIFLIMENIVTILQAMPGVVVPGWPILTPGQLVPGN
jgi:hypothetical protein